jgi:hypothetical protein
MAKDLPLGPKILSLDEILSAPDIEDRLVHVAQWGGAVKIRSFTKRQQQDLRTRATVGEEIDGNRLEMLMFIEGVIEPRFSEEQYGQLVEKSAGAIDAVLKEIMALSGFNADEVEKAEKRFPKR